MRREKAAVRALIVVAAVCVTGCAARGGTPRPFPTPHPANRPAVVAGDQGAAALLGTAMALIGTPYHAGGDRPARGFDCSGFVEWVFRSHGVALPRTVEGQLSTGTVVRRGEAPEAADLVFFQTSGRGASHVGIALGDGRFIHAPSTRGVVRVEPLSSRYWSQRFVGARRILERSPSVAESRD